MVGWFSGVLDFLTPPRCVSCGDEDRWWCDRCAGKVEQRLVRESAPSLDGIVAAAYYGPPLKQGLRALKYRHATVVAPALARYLPAPLATIEASRLLLVPVPLHPSRLRQRGHNQAALLAAALAKESRLPLSEQLVRTRRTASQTTLDKRQRAANVAGAFEWRGPSLSGRTVVIIDDVTTTGATFTACAAALQAATPAHMWGVAVAKKR